VSFASAIYRATPFRALREVYFAVFARLVGNRKAVVDINGLLFDLDLGESIDLRLYLGQFEPDVTATLCHHAKPGMTVLDIGANIGAFTMLLASLVGRNGQVIAFEPTDFGWRKLQRNLSLNQIPWITAVKAGLAEKTMFAEQVDFRASWRTNGGRADACSVVDFIRLDDWCREHGVSQVDLIKIDVDGYEYSVFAGARELLARHQPVIVAEAVSPHFENEQRNPFRLLLDSGYELHDLQTGKVLSLDDLRRRLPETDPGMTVSTNVLAIPRAKE
jgi:FkbM family methyltransferase